MNDEVTKDEFVPAEPEAEQAIQPVSDEEAAEQELTDQARREALTNAEAEKAASTQPEEPRKDAE